jgi:hypothetical protein
MIELGDQQILLLLCLSRCGDIASEGRGPLPVAPVEASRPPPWP